MRSTVASLVYATVVVALITTVPVLAQGKSSQDHGKGGGSSAAGSSNKGGKASSGGASGGDVSPPSQVPLAGPTTIAAATPATPFAWVDNANLMTPGSVWVGLSMVRWHNAGLSEMSIPVVDGAVGVTPRLQIGASVPRVMANSEFVGQQGGAGTTFLNGKIGILSGSERSVKITVTPTLEILSRAAMQSMPIGEHRLQWGLPASIEIDRGIGRVYGSTGYFSPGIRYTGLGAGALLTDRVDVTLTLSRAWSSPSTLADSSSQSAVRHDLSTGVSLELTPNIGVFGSVGRTFRTAPQFGAGTTMSVGLSLTADRLAFKD